MAARDRLANAVFLSTLSLRRATTTANEALQKIQDFYPRSPCGERRFFCRALQNKFPISIHALLAESDTMPDLCQRYVRISIHALLAESDRNKEVAIWQILIFLSTLSLRRATKRGGRQNYPYPISIHALLAESDDLNLDWIIKALTISIHALLAESDGKKPCGIPPLAHFYPRSPCGERLANGM